MWPRVAHSERRALLRGHRPVVPTMHVALRGSQCDFHQCDTLYSNLRVETGVPWLQTTTALVLGCVPRSVPSLIFLFCFPVGWGRDGRGRRGLPFAFICSWHAGRRVGGLLCASTRRAALRRGSSRGLTLCLRHVEMFLEEEVLHFILHWAP